MLIRVMSSDAFARSPTFVDGAGKDCDISENLYFLLKSSYAPFLISVVSIRIVDALGVLTVLFMIVGLKCNSHICLLV